MASYGHLIWNIAGTQQKRHHVDEYMVTGTWIPINLSKHLDLCLPEDVI